MIDSGVENISLMQPTCKWTHSTTYTFPDTILCLLIDGCCTPSSSHRSTIIHSPIAWSCLCFSSLVSVDLIISCLVSPAVYMANCWTTTVDVRARYESPIRGFVCEITACIELTAVKMYTGAAQLARNIIRRPVCCILFYKIRICVQKMKYVKIRCASHRNALRTYNIVITYNLLTVLCMVPSLISQPGRCDSSNTLHTVLFST